MKSWLVIGVVQNWETALKQAVPVWGLKNSFGSDFAALGIGDLLYLYATSPVRGCIGIGAVKDKYVDDRTLVWADELRQGQVIWPLRFRIQLLRVLPRSLWTSENPASGPIRIADFGLLWQRGFQPLSPQHTEELAKRTQTLWPGSIYEGATIVSPDPRVAEAAVPYGVSPPAEPVVPEHRRFQNAIAEAGKLQQYFSEIEYPLQIGDRTQRLDVIWKHEAEGVPTFAYEVELSGGVEKAFIKLRTAFQRWNSRPILVVPPSEHMRAQDLAAKENRLFQESFRCYEPQVLDDLLKKKRELRDFEKRLRLY